MTVAAINHVATALAVEVRYLRQQRDSLVSTMRAAEGQRQVNEAYLADFDERIDAIEAHMRREGWTQCP